VLTLPFQQPVQLRDCKGPTSTGCVQVTGLGLVSFRVPFRFRVNYVSENTSAHNAHQPLTDNTRTDADLLRARRNGNYGQRNAKGKREGGENTPNALCVGTRHANMHVIHGAPYTEGFEVYERYLHLRFCFHHKRFASRAFCYFHQ
jgi:hypothetical protein